jgi:hypothetical protein
MMPASACVVNAFPTEGLTASNNTYAASRSNPCQWLLSLQLYFILDYTSIFKCVKDIVHVDEGQTRRFTTNYLLDLTIGFADALLAPSLSLSPTAVDHGVPNSACARDQPYPQVAIATRSVACSPALYSNNFAPWPQYRSCARVIWLDLVQVVSPSDLSWQTDRMRRATNQAAQGVGKSLPCLQHRTMYNSAPQQMSQGELTAPGIPASERHSSLGAPHAI